MITEIELPVPHAPVCPQGTKAASAPPLAPSACKEEAKEEEESSELPAVLGDEGEHPAVWEYNGEAPAVCDKDSGHLPVGDEDGGCPLVWDEHGQAPMACDEDDGNLPVWNEDRERPVAWEEEGEPAAFWEEDEEPALLWEEDEEPPSAPEEDTEAPCAAGSWAEHSDSSTALQPEGSGEWSLMQLSTSALFLCARAGCCVCVSASAAPRVALQLNGTGSFIVLPQLRARGSRPQGVGLHSGSHLRGSIFPLVSFREHRERGGACREIPGTGADWPRVSARQLLLHKQGPGILLVQDPVRSQESSKPLQTLGYNAAASQC